MTHVAATKLVLLPYSLGFGGRSIEQKKGSGSDQGLFLSPFSDVGMGLARPAGDVPLVVPSCQQWKTSNLIKMAENSIGNDEVNRPEDPRRVDAEC
jgi:hypothetical protein